MTQIQPLNMKNVLMIRRM